jgi:DNA-binding response OmpR family regulator
MLGNPAQLEATELPRLSALVIEADADSSRAAAAALESAQIRTTVSEDPVYALGLLATTDFDLLVTGIHLQDMTGFEVLTQLESIPRHAQTPVIFVTSHDNFGSYQLDGLVARHELIAKPFLPIELALKARARAQRRPLQP